MNITIKKSRRKTISLQVTEDLEVILRAPLQMSTKEIEHFLRSKETWIETAIQKLSQKQRLSAAPFTENELQELKYAAEKDLSARVERFAPVIGVSYGKINCRSMTSRWGSCSAEGNLSFNVLLMLTPEEVRDYLVIHELCHRKHMNHSKSYWNEVAKYCPQYKTARKWLKDHASPILSRLKAYKKQEPK